MVAGWVVVFGGFLLWLGVKKGVVWFVDARCNSSISIGFNFISLTVQLTSLLALRLLSLIGLLMLLLVLSQNAIRLRTSILSSLRRQRLLQHVDIFPQALRLAICSTATALERRYAHSHLLTLNLPGIPVPLMSVPLGLEEAHNTYITLISFPFLF